MLLISAEGMSDGRACGVIGAQIRNMSWSDCNDIIDPVMITHAMLTRLQRNVTIIGKGAMMMDIMIPVTIMERTVRVLSPSWGGGG